MDFAAIFAWIVASGPNMLVAFMAVLSALIAFFMLIPGVQPEATLQKVLDFLAKFSKK